MGDKTITRDPIERIDDVDFISNQFLREVKGEQAVSSTMFDKIFINSKTIPRQLIDAFASNPEDVEKLLTASMPIWQTDIQKPYWKTQHRGYDKINVDIFGAVCLAADRHLLDVIIAHGTLINNAEKYSLRQVSQGIEDLIDVDWSLVSSELIDRKLLNRGVYFHITFSDICRALNIKPLKKNRALILKRLHRLSIMTLTLTPSLEGNEDRSQSINVSLIDKDIITLLDRGKPRSSQFNNETRTDLIVNISSYYVQTLSKDGSISRKRLIKNYRQLTGRNSIEDVYKNLDTHQREYIHGKRLSWFVTQYLDNKMGSFGVNQSFKTQEIFNQIVEDKEKLATHFNLMLRKTESESGKGSDYTFHYRAT